MTMAGLSTKQQEWLIGLATEPLNVRIIQTVLVEALKHPAIAAQAQADFGARRRLGAGRVSRSWILAAGGGAGRRRRAGEGAGRGGRRAIGVAKATPRGTQSDNAQEVRGRAACDTHDAVTQLTGDQYTAAMALEALTDVDYEIGLTLLDSAVKSIREAYLAGQITIDQAAAQLTVLGVLEARRINYVQQWTWETIGEGADAIDRRNLGRAQAGIADAGGRIAAVGKSRLDGPGRYN